MLEKKVVVGNKGSNFKIDVGQFFRDKQFPYLKCPKTGVHVACFGIGNDWIGLSVGKQLFFFFFTGELGAVFFLGHNYAIPLPSDAELVGKYQKQHIFFGEKTSGDFLGFAKNNSCDFHHTRQLV